jgi:DNA-binding NtrC family response regulator
MSARGFLHAGPTETGAGMSAERSAGRILIVEDDVLIRAAAAQYLRGAGFEVLEAVSVEQAIELLQAGRVQVVFTDVKLPGPQSGLDLMHIVQRDFPSTKVLLTSGVVKVTEGMLEGVTLLRKPYFLFEVERHLRTLLAG